VTLKSPLTYGFISLTSLTSRTPMALNKYFIIIITTITSPHLTYYHLNWVRRDWSQPRQTGSCIAKWLSSPWLRPITAHSVQVTWGQMRRMVLVYTKQMWVVLQCEQG